MFAALHFDSQNEEHRNLSVSHDSGSGYQEGRDPPMYRNAWKPPLVRNDKSTTFY
jgi:hypothetical protein